MRLICASSLSGLSAGTEYLLFVLFLIVFIGLAGFGITLPLFPFYADRLGASPEIITLTVSAYSLGQFVAAPVWGRLSDSWGRKWVLVLTMLGSAVSYLMLGYADELWILLASRVFGGLMAGNIAAAFAYVTDISDEKSRGGAMGIISAALGLGFMLGPAIGGFLAGNDMQTADFMAPAVAAAAASIIAMLGAIFMLPESLPEADRKPLFGSADTATESVSVFTRLRSRPVMLKLMVVAFLFYISMAMMEGIYPLWVYQLFGVGPVEIGYMFLMMGAITVFVQGFLMGKLVPVFGEKTLVIFASGAFMLGMIGFAASTSTWHAYASLAVFSVGTGFMNPGLSSLVSMTAAADERGTVMGWFQSASALGRVVGPALAGPLYAQVAFGAPYVVGAIVIVPVILLLVTVPIKGASAESRGGVSQP
jgi:DHA1 family tetracycline resistance protein-like MFS transporter